MSHYNKFNNPFKYTDPSGYRMAYSDLQFYEGYYQETGGPTNYINPYGHDVVFDGVANYSYEELMAYNGYTWVTGPGGNGVWASSDEYFSGNDALNMAITMGINSGALLEVSDPDPAGNVMVIGVGENGGFSRAIPYYKISGTYLNSHSSFAPGVLNNNSKEMDNGKLAALVIRNSKRIGLAPNPFYKAEAIMGDAGLTIAGSEGDAGYVFALAGPDIGKIRPITEIAGGAGSDVGAGIELTRVDYIGDINNFTLSSLNGPRDKIYGGVEITGEGLSIGGAFTWGYSHTGGYVIGTSIQGGWGVSLIPFFYGGYNYGNLTVH